MSDWREHWDQILERVSAGETLREVCRSLKVPHTTILHAVAVDRPEGIADQYARARISQAHSMADEIVAVSDDSSQDTETDEKGNRRMNGEWVQRSRLRVDTRKWLLARLHPKVYGDRVDVTSGGEKVGPIAMLPASLVLQKPSE